MASVLTDILCSLFEFRKGSKDDQKRSPSLDNSLYSEILLTAMTAVQHWFIFNPIFPSTEFFSCCNMTKTTKIKANAKSGIPWMTANTKSATGDKDKQSGIE